MNERHTFLEFARKLARVAEERILPFYGRCQVEHKADGSEVTEADRQAERAMRAAIVARFPDHDILGEEFGTQGRGTTPYRWVIDPLDGTAWFTLGMPTFGTLVALLEGGQPVVGVVHFPALHETLYASRGAGCWFVAQGAQPRRVRVSPQTELQRAVASASGAHSSDILVAEGEVPYGLTRLIRRAGKFNFCPDCLQHALVCRGQLHLAVDPVMKPWDSAALVVCVWEAGGVVSTLGGKQDDVTFGGSLLSACTPELCAQAVEALAPQS